ncbi:uncharacterized protein [Clytia hemisphaerica]|uniref:uncharacterized protein n=1 Tax=Clytia hemisphaerica TaxID=252671 RepID=UPI0034D5376D
MESSRGLKKRIRHHQGQNQIPNKEDRHEECSIRQESCSNENNRRTIIQENHNVNQVDDVEIKINEIRIFYCNADTLTPEKKRQLVLDVEKHHPHIIAICEVKPKHDGLRELHEHELKHYKCVSHTNMTTGIGRGIIILAHSSIKHLVTDVNQSMNQVNFNEVSTIEIRLSGNDLLVFSCIYRSPTNNDTSAENNNNKLNHLIKDIASNNKYSHKCFVGDFNFPTINWKNWTTPHLEESEANQALCLEYLSPLCLSDHSCLTFTIKCDAVLKPKSERYKYEDADFEAMKQDLNSDDWYKQFPEMADSKSTEELWQLFRKKILDIRNRFVPIKIIGGQNWRKKGKIPIGVQLRKEIAEKRRLHRKWMKSSPEEKEYNRAKYTPVRNRVSKLMKQAHRNYEQRICDNAKTKPKIFWSHVRNKMKSSSTVSSLLESPNVKTSLKHEDHEKANILQRQFCSVFTKEAVGELPAFEKRTDSSIRDIHISEEMVQNRLKELNHNKSFGPDEIHPRILAELSDYLSLPLAVIMNKSLVEGSLLSG